MCKFCENKKSLYRENLREDEYNEVWIDNSNLRIVTHVYDDYFCQYYDFPIKYCPMCGKELSSKNSENNLEN